MENTRQKSAEDEVRLQNSPQYFPVFYFGQAFFQNHFPGKDTLFNTLILQNYLPVNRLQILSDPGPQLRMRYNKDFLS